MRAFKPWRLRRAAKWAGVRPSAAEAVNQAAGLHLHAWSSLSATLSSGAIAARCRGVNPEASFTSACRDTTASATARVLKLSARFTLACCLSQNINS